MPINIRHIEFFIHICKLILNKIYDNNKVEIIIIVTLIVILMCI